MKSGEFRAWNLADFMKSGGFHAKDLVLMKNTAFSGRIPNEPKIQHSVVDLVLSCISVLVLTGFSVDHEIWQISWNLADFMVRTYGCIPNEPKMQHSVVDLVLSCISVLFCRKIQQNPLFMKSDRFHGEIQQISWNQADFMADLEKYHLKM